MPPYPVDMLLAHGDTPPVTARLVSSSPPSCRVPRSGNRTLLRVWDAVAASGADDHILFLEHPELPEHWRSRSGHPGS